MREISAIQKNLLAAVAEGDTVVRDTLRLLSSALHKEEIAKQGKLSGNDQIGVLRKEAKQRRESIEAYTQAGRADLADREGDELRVILEYLPPELSKEEIDAAIERVILDTGGATLNARGKIIGKVMRLLGGRVDGRVVDLLVTERLKDIHA